MYITFYYNTNFNIFGDVLLLQNEKIILANVFLIPGMKTHFEANVYILKEIQSLVMLCSV